MQYGIVGQRQRHHCALATVQYLGRYRWKNLILIVHSLDEDRVQVCHLMVCRVIPREQFNFGLALGQIDRL